MRGELDGTGESDVMMYRGRAAAAVLLVAALCAGCVRTPAPVHADFDHWTADDGTTRWRLTLPPETWHRFGHGEPLDAANQNLSARTVASVPELIDASLAHMHLCPGAWTMANVRHFEDGYLSFKGACDAPAGTRT